MAHIFSLNYYKKSSSGEHDFSRKQAWFYVYGDEDIRNEFATDITEMVDSLFVKDKEKWDVITTYPTYVKNKVNSNLNCLVKQVSENTGIRNEQLLRRKHTIRESHELNSVREKIINLEGSINVEGDVRGKNVILVNNISLSGVSLMHATDMLKEAGANKVACVCLGVDYQKNEEDYEFTDETAHQMFGKSLNSIEVKRGD